MSSSNRKPKQYDDDLEEDDDVDLDEELDDDEDLFPEEDNVMSLKCDSNTSIIPFHLVQEAAKYEAFFDPPSETKQKKKKTKKDQVQE